jgi:hypothetical protein
VCLLQWHETNFGRPASACRAHTLHQNYAMIGHGRPASFALALARAMLLLCAGLSQVAWAENSPPSESTLLRITWGGGEASHWLGRIAVDDGAISNLKILSQDADAAGSIWLDNRQLLVNTLSPHKLDSIEVAAQTTANAKLQIELSPNDGGAGTRFEVPLADLPRHPYQTKLDGHGNTLEIQIVSAPALSITPSRSPLIFAPGEQCSFEVTPKIPALAPGTEFVVQTTLMSMSPTRRKEKLWNDNPQRVAVPVDGHPKVMLNVPLPNAEGVYAIHVEISRPGGFARVWAASTRLAEQVFQVAVLESNPRAPAADARWDSVLEIDPTSPGWFDRLPSWTQVARFPGLNRGALGNGHAAAVDLPLGRFVELQPKSPNADPHWQAYSLPVQAVGVPHLLEIDFPADAPQHFGVSIVEPNALGVVAGINRDAGVYVEGLGRSEAKEKRTERLVFWPRTQTPLLVVTNMHPTAAAHFGPIRVFKRSTNQLNALPQTAASHDRLIAAYLARPTVGETFGSSRAADGLNVAVSPFAGSIDDCETAYENATRLADYLRYGGYNSAVVNAARVAQGPPASLDVDNLEVIFRVFDRENLALLPALDFASPLPQLEQLRRGSDPRTSGLEWLGADGRTWLDLYGTRRGLAPYYNLLDPRVQQALLDTVRDLSQRYGAHRAFSGVAIQLSSDGYGQLPPLDWGLDDVTIARFERDAGVHLDAIGDQRFEARSKLLAGQHAAAWRAWRTTQVSKFYAQLAALVRGNTDRRVVLTTENVFANPLLAARMRPNLIGENAASRMASTLLDVGLDRAALDRAPGLILCSTRFVEPAEPLPDAALALQLNDANSNWRGQADVPATRAAMLYHRPRRQRLASFETARTPWRVAGEAQIVSQPLPEGPGSRKPYLQSLIENDPSVIIDGGELLPLGQEDALRAARLTLAQLPTNAQVTEVAKQPVTIRAYAEPNRVTLVAMNLSPWHCDARVAIDVPQATSLSPISEPASNEIALSAPVPLPAGRQSWPVSLGPYEMRAVQIPMAGAKVVDVQADLNAVAYAELGAALNDLNNRDLTAQRTYEALANPSFEPAASGGRVTGWHLIGTDAKSTAALDATNPQDGKSCLYLRTAGPPIVVESDPFPMPQTGQLAMTIYARGQNLDPNAELQLILEADGQTYRRARVHANEMSRPDGQWGQGFVIMVNDLPLESRGQMRVAFQLSGAGEIWLDNAKLYDLLFTQKFYGSSAQAEILALSTLIHAAKSAFDKQPPQTPQITDCVQILDGYWPRFILANRPPTVPQQIAQRESPKVQSSPPQTNEGQELTPSYSNPLKRFVPLLR